MATVAIDTKNKKVTLTLDLIEDPQPSKSGKSKIIATTGGGMKTTATFNGDPVDINVNVYVKQ